MDRTRDFFHLFLQIIIIIIYAEQFLAGNHNSSEICPK